MSKNQAKRLEKEKIRRKGEVRGILVEEVLCEAALLGRLRKAETQEKQARRSDGACKTLRIGQ